VEREQKRIRANENDEVIVENASPVTTHPYFHVHIPPPRVVTLSSPNNITPTCVHTSPPHDSLRVQSDSLEDDDDYLDSLCDYNVPTEIQHLIAKMGDTNYRLFEYRIVNLSEKNLVDPVNKVFSGDDKKRMRRLWEEVCIILAINFGLQSAINLIYSFRWNHRSKRS